MNNQLTQELLQFVKRSDGRINSVKLTEQCFSRNDKLYLWVYMHEATSQFTIPLSLGDRVFLLEAGIEKESLCKICNSKPRIIVAYTPPKRYSEYCSQACSSRESANKIIGCQTRNETLSAEKRKKTMFDKYGVDYNSQRGDIHHIWKRQKTYMNRDAFEQKGINYDDLLKTGVVETLWKDNPSLQEMANKLGGVNTGNIYTLFRTVNFKPVFEKNSSSQERRIVKFLTDNGTVLERNTRIIIKPMELDIYIPSKKLAIEVNGHFWHRSEQIGNSYHLKKLRLCEKFGVTLLQFWDNDIDDKFNIVTSIIANKVGLNNHQKYNARDLDMVIVDGSSSKSERDRVNQFFITNHIQGSCVFNTAGYLSSNGEIISCMTIGHRRFVNKSKSDGVEHELSRYANKIGTLNRGAASKLFKHLKEHCRFNSIISYSDNFISTGNMYKQLGFEYSHESAPAYSWIIDDQIVPRYRTRHDQLTNLIGESYSPDLSEAENMETIGAYKIHNAGNKVWIWHRV